MTTNRRQFIGKSLAAGAVLGAPMIVPSRVFGANAGIRVGIVGLGGRGAGSHLPSFQKQDGVNVVALADPDGERLGAAAKILREKFGQEADCYSDMRRMFDRKDIDVIANATQNYWHGLSTIWACQAGKHVYVEKPLSHYIWEGRQMVNAARKYDRIVQCGTQRRSQESIAEAIEWIREGHLGKIECVTAFANKMRKPCGKRETPLPIPESVDFDLWCGPAKKVPIYRDRLQYDCSFDWNTGDGESCNQGVHEVDVARWCLGEKALPRRVLSLGGRFLFNDACDVPNTQIVCYDFPSAPLLYEVHNLPESKGSGKAPRFRDEGGVGVVADCEGGSVSLYRGIAWDADGKEVRKFSGGGDHFVNFIEAVRSGRRDHLNAEVEVGHVSTAVSHTGNISYRVGEPASAAKQRDAVADIPSFNDMYDRFLAHLQGHGIAIDSVILGDRLEVDAPNECFQGHAQANELARGFYRPPYVVPDLSL